MFVKMYSKIETYIFVYLITFMFAQMKSNMIVLVFTIVQTNL